MDHQNPNPQESEKQQHRIRRRRHIIDFCKGFFVTLVFILPLFGGVYYFQIRPEAEPDPATEVSDPAVKLPVTTPSNYNLLWMVTDGQTGELAAVALLRFDTDNYRVLICDLPVNTVVLSAKSPITLQQLHGQRGAAGVRASLEETLAVPVSGYIALSTEDLIKLIDNLGYFSFTLDRELVISGENGLIAYTKPAGTSSMNGNDLGKLLVYGDYEDLARQQLHENLWQAALLSYADDSLSGKVTEWYLAQVNSINTDINRAGVNTLTRAISAVCPAGGAQLEIVRAKGSFVGDRYELSEGSDEHLWTYFSQVAG